MLTKESDSDWPINWRCATINRRLRSGRISLLICIIAPLHPLFCCLFRYLLCFLLLHPADEEDTDDHYKEDVSWNPHNQASQLLICGGGNAPDARCGQVWCIQWRQKC